MSLVFHLIHIVPSTSSEVCTFYTAYNAEGTYQKATANRGQHRVTCPALKWPERGADHVAPNVKISNAFVSMPMLPVWLRVLMHRLGGKFGFKTCTRLIFIVIVV
jgi:hypothetical protein